MSSSVRIRVLALVIAALLRAGAAQNWVEIHSPHFMVFAEAGENRGREIAGQWEAMRRAYFNLVPRESAKAPPICVIAFRSATTMKNALGAHTPVRSIFAPAPGRSCAIIDGSAVTWPEAFAAYAHDLLALNMPRTPAWFDNGLADYYATIVTTKEHFRFGVPPAGFIDQARSRLVPSGPFLDQTLIAVTEAQRPQAWLLVHWALQNNKLEPLTVLFSALVKDRQPAAAAIPAALGMPPTELDRTLQTYLSALQPREMPNTAPIEASLFNARKLKPYESYALMGEALTRVGDPSGALSLLVPQLATEPLSASLHLAASFAYAANKDEEKAKHEAYRAVELQSEDPRAYFQYGELLYRSRSDQLDPELLVDITQMTDRTERMEPSFAEAYALKAAALVAANNVGGAVNELRVAVRLRPRNELYQLELARAYGLARKYDDANLWFAKLQRSLDPAIVKATNAEIATLKTYQADPLAQLGADAQDRYTNKQWRPKPGKQNADLEALEAAQSSRNLETTPQLDTRPMKFAKGLLAHAECSAGSAVLYVTTTAGQRLRLRAKQIAGVPLVGASSFDCGWKRRKVAFNYRVAGAGAGDLVSLEIAE